MDHAKFNFTMVPPSTPDPNLGLTSNLALSQDNYPTLSSSAKNKRQRPDSDDENNISTVFKPVDNFAKFLVIKSNDSEKPITSLSPFVIEKQIESTIGTPKSVKKLKNQTLLVETSRKTQTENLLKMKTFFNLPVTVSEHHTLNSSKGIIRDRALKGETEENIKEYLKDQGVIAVKRFTIKKGNSTIETNTLLLTFNRITVPKVTQNITFIEARNLFEKQPDTSFSKIVQSVQMKKPETKTTETHFDEKDFNITASSKVIIPTIYKTKKQSAQNTAASSSSQPGPSKSNNQHEKTRSRSKTRTTSRDNSKSPKTKEKPNVKITRIQQDQPVKTANKYGQLESMET